MNEPSQIAKDAANGFANTLIALRAEQISRLTEFIQSAIDTATEAGHEKDAKIAQMTEQRNHYYGMTVAMAELLDSAPHTIHEESSEFYSERRCVNDCLACAWERLKSK